MAKTADAQTPDAIAVRLARVHPFGLYVLGSMRNPTIPAKPRPAQTSVATESPWLARRDATSAATGMGQGAATPAPQPRRIPVGTEKGAPMPSGRPGRSSRTATALVNPTVHANATAARLRARPVASVLETRGCISGTPLGWYGEVRRGASLHFGPNGEPAQGWMPHEVGGVRTTLRLVERW